MNLLLAAAKTTWPDGVDASALGLFLAVALGVPLAGYVCLVLDFRRYLRSLRRALVVLTTPPRIRNTPYWALKQRPPCLMALGLPENCSEHDVLAAYRVRVKEFHPDRGGDMQQFLKLQRHFEQAMHFTRQQAQRHE